MSGMAMALGASGVSVGKNPASPYIYPSGNSLQFHTLSVRWGTRNVGAHCTNIPGGGPGETDSKAVLDAFFIGKAFAEAINERIGTAVGEFLSEVGRWQAEQQKQTRDFQEEVLERARIAKEKAAREALANKQIKVVPSSSYISSKSAATDSSSASDNYASSADPRSVSNNDGPLQRKSNGK